MVEDSVLSRGLRLGLFKFIVIFIEQKQIKPITTGAKRKPGFSGVEKLAKVLGSLNLDCGAS